MLERDINWNDRSQTRTMAIGPDATIAHRQPNGIQHVARVVTAPSVARSAEFRDRLMARDAVRPISTMAMLATMEMSDEARQHHKVSASSQKRMDLQRGDVPDLPDNAVSDGGGGGGSAGGSGGGHSSSGGGRSGGTDTSQIVWAGLAALGLAGVTVLVSQNAFNDDDDTTFIAATTTDTATSTAQLAELSKPDEKVETAAVDTVVDSAKADREAERARLEAAEKEALKLAATERAQEAAEEAQKVAEAQRLADLEAERLAALAEAEKLQARKLAKAEADRKAETARKLAKAEADKKAETARKLAELEERNRLKAEAAAQARKLAEQERAAAAVQVAYTGLVPTPASIKPARVIAPKAVAALAPSQPMAALIPINAVMPSAPAMKPSQVRRIAANYVRQNKPVQPVAASLRTSSVGVISAPSHSRLSQSRTRPSSQRVEDFVAERIEKSSTQSISTANMARFENQFLSLLDTAADGRTVNTQTPDGRELVFSFESTRPRQVYQRVLQPVSYRTGSNAGPLRLASGSRLQLKTIMCRDVQYSFPGTERGRFAACPSDDGTWRIARASETNYPFRGVATLP